MAQRTAILTMGLQISERVIKSRETVKKHPEQSQGLRHVFHPLEKLDGRTREKHSWITIYLQCCMRFSSQDPVSGVKPAREIDICKIKVRGVGTTYKQARMGIGATVFQNSDQHTPVRSASSMV